MPENSPGPTPNVPPTSGPRPAPKHKQEEPIDRAHIPMSEEFDRAKWTLPPMGVVGIALAIVAVALLISAYVFRAKPVAGGGIGDVTAVQLQDNTILAAIQLSVSNVTEKSWYIKEISATAATDQGEHTDSAATATDSERYFQAFPDLGKGALPILRFDQKIDPGQQVSGTIVVGFPVSKEQFDARKSLTVTVLPFDNRPFVLKK